MAAASGILALPSAYSKALTSTDEHHFKEVIPVKAIVATTSQKISVIMSEFTQKHHYYMKLKENKNTLLWPR